MQKSLNYNQIIRGAMIFLNTFGLILEIPEEIDKNTILRFGLGFGSKKTETLVQHLTIIVPNFPFA